jgi:transmembrane 9 superfamily member 2/4
MFGFLLVSFLLTIIVCAETSIICCYFMLRAEDYHWWWRSFLASGSAAIYAFATSGIIFAKHVPVTGLTNFLIYTLWTLVICSTLFLALGTIGFLASFLFVRAIYNRIRLE